MPETLVCADCETPIEYSTGRRPERCRPCAKTRTKRLSKEYAGREEYLAIRAAWQRTRYADDPEFRERILERGRAKDKTPEGRAAKLARKKRWRAANREAYLAQCRRQNERRRQRPEVAADARRRTREWAAKYPGRVFAQRLAKYGITIHDYVELMRQQRNRCAICGEHESARRPSGKRKRLAVDHCHETGKVRALLCQLCNNGLGHLRDNPDVIRRAAYFIETHRRTV